MKSKKQKRAEALSRLERLHAANPDATSAKRRADHIKYLHSIAERPGGRVKGRKAIAPASESQPGNPAGMPPHVPWHEFMGEGYAS